MNILTIDVEEWFHLLDFNATKEESDWGRYDVRIYENMERLFRVLEDANAKATFFIIGWIAKTYPDLVRRIAERYQIGCHTMGHQLVWQQSPSEFRVAVENGVKMLEDVSGKKVECFRAPGFSIRESEGWAYEILSEYGFKYDCSVFPAAHAHGGLPSYPNSTPGIIEYKGIQIKEFPVSFKTIAGKHIVFSGGGYFRLCPYSLIRKWSKESSDYLMAYIHPRDLDAGQPVLSGLPLERRFKSYVGLRGAEKKLRRWMAEFQFIDVEMAESMVDWTKAPIVRLKDSIN
ncbi:MAG: polysaccharide deacetylase family protein [Bacteroidales bacterium]|nr:polysaccharide deacetylase family protein [Bacteroidales bacterium]